MTNYIVNNMSKSDKKKLALCVAIPLVVGILSAFATKNQMESFELVAKPPLSPPGWVFPTAWSILYILMGVASFLVLSSTAYKTKIDKALMIYGVQLAVNFFWSIIFFNLGEYLFSFVWLVLLLFLVVYTAKLFYGCNKTACYLLIPYILWIVFAGYLNFGVFLLNK